MTSTERDNTFDPHQQICGFKAIYSSAPSVLPLFASLFTQSHSPSSSFKMGRRSRNNQVVLNENHRKEQRSPEVDGIDNSSGQRGVERDLLIPPIDIARGNPHTGKIGSQRPAAEQHNRMIALQERKKYRADCSKNAISRAESNRLYAEIRGQLYSPDAFSLPRGTLTMGKMRQNHFRKLMQLRKSLEKRCVSLGRAVGHWSADNFVDDVLRRDRIRGLTPRSKYFETETRADFQERNEVPAKRSALRVNDRSRNACARKERGGRVISNNNKGVAPKHGNSALSSDVSRESGKILTSNVKRTREKPSRMNYSDSDEDIRNPEDSESEEGSDEDEQYGYEQQNDDEFGGGFDREQDNGDQFGDDSESDVGIHEDDHLPHRNEEFAELFQLREQILQLLRETSMDDLAVSDKDDKVEHHSDRHAKQKRRKRARRDANVTSGKLKLKKKNKRRHQ